MPSQSAAYGKQWLLVQLRLCGGIKVFGIFMALPDALFTTSSIVFPGYLEHPSKQQCVLFSLNMMKTTGIFYVYKICTIPMCFAYETIGIDENNRFALQALWNLA